MRNNFRFVQMCLRIMLMRQQVKQLSIITVADGVE